MPDRPELNLDATITRLNKEYAAVVEEGQFKILRENFDPVFKRNKIDRLSVQSFKDMFRNKKVSCSVASKDGSRNVTKSAAEWWLDDERRREYTYGVLFDPSGQVREGWWNLWTGWAIKPKRGDWSLMRSHIREVICGGRPDLEDYVIGWTARMFQTPQHPGDVALVLRGKKGTGKGTLGFWLGRIAGQHGLQVANAKHVTGSFNGHLQDCVFLFADEACFSGDASQVGILNNLITEKVITIEAKHRNAVTAPNMLHVMMASNNDLIVPASGDERRYCVVDVLPIRQKDGSYFGALNDQMENGGAAAMLYDLLEMDLTDFDHRVVPETDALRDQKLLNLNDMEQWLFAILSRGWAYRSRHGHLEFIEWKPMVATQLLVRSYQQHCSDNKIARPADQARIGKILTKVFGEPRRVSGRETIGEINSPDRLGGDVIQRVERPMCYELGTIQQAREKFSRRLEIPVDWQDDEAPPPREHPPHLRLITAT